MAYQEAEPRLLTHKQPYTVPFDFREDLLEFIRAGDTDSLLLGLDDGSDQYCDSVMLDLEHAHNIFLFNLSLAYYSAYAGGLSMEAGQKICAYFDFEQRKKETVLEIRELQKEMMIEFARQVKEIRKLKEKPLRVRRALEYIHSHIDEKLSVEELAEQCQVSASTLQRRFLRCTGISVGQYIRQERVRRACVLLEHTEMTGAEISVSLGFCSQSYFIQQFRAETGITPREYRDGVPSRRDTTSK